MKMHEVSIGTAIVALIEPHEGQAREFNRWYEGDHFYAAVTGGPGAFAGKRWVANRACKAARAGGTLFGDRNRGSYLTTAWILEGRQPAWDEWVRQQMKAITEQDRLFAGRDHVHTAVYSHIATVGPAVYALDRGYEGVLAIATTASSTDAVAWTHDNVGSAGIDAAVVLAPLRVVLSEADPGEHMLILAFTTGDPIAASKRLDLPPGAGFASPFLATVPGTDTYTDDL
ncbi:MAG: hypothetical protein SGJ13_06505 [Actinomycetota bacterium]|nr:hypothetical protein [Actinomycetota bacterium]